MFSLISFLGATELVFAVSKQINPTSSQFSMVDVFDQKFIDIVHNW